MPSTDEEAVGASSSSEVSQLRASYASPDGTRSFEQRLPSSAGDAARSTAAKTSYLASLRGSVAKLQDEVNAFLTQKMEEDKAAVGQAAGAERSTSAAKDEARAEETYGEEVVDEDA